MPILFITGVTGYIGGDVFHELYMTQPAFTYVALMRSEQKAKKLKELYPKVETVIGDLDDYNLICEQSARAMIVIHTADSSDHERAARAIGDGLSQSHTKDHPGFWLHVGGTGLFTYEDTKNNRLGESSDKVYDDWDKLYEVTNMPDEAFHRKIDKIVLEAERNYDSVKAAIICPPTIYGKGRGPFNKRGRQAYELAKVILTDQYVPIIGQGKARWNQLHVADLTRLFQLFIRNAMMRNVDSEMWGERGYYIAERGEFVWGDVARLMGKTAVELGYIPEAKERSLSKDEAMKQAGFEAVSWGLNSRAKGIRAGRLLHWAPREHSLADEVPNILKEEHERLFKASPTS